MFDRIFHDAFQRLFEEYDTRVFAVKYSIRNITKISNINLANCGIVKIFLYNYCVINFFHVANTMHLTTE
jgi:hypothetical protein